MDHMAQMAELVAMRGLFLISTDEGGGSGEQTTASRKNAKCNSLKPAFSYDEVYLPLVDIELLNSVYISAALSLVWHLVQMRSDRQFVFFRR